MNARKKKIRREEKEGNFTMCGRPKSLPHDIFPSLEDEVWTGAQKLGNIFVSILRGCTILENRNPGLKNLGGDTGVRQADRGIGMPTPRNPGRRRGLSGKNANRKIQSAGKPKKTKPHRTDKQISRTCCGSQGHLKT